MRPTLLFLLSFAVCTVTFSQEKINRNNYTLLWEITGENLAQPSYVFGSMHLRNKAVFEFPDSLVICMKNCEIFAGEVQMDSAMQRIFELYIGGDELNLDNLAIEDSSFIAAPTLLIDSLLEETREEETRQGELYTATELAEQEERQEIYNERGFMPTMLDAYLMNLARSYGLTITGLENIDEHIGEEDEETFTPSFLGGSTANLMDLYYRGNIEEIGEYVKANSPSFEVFDLTPRNYIMLRSMKKIMPQNPLFAVVGTAHLPGEEGLINLLRKEGYQVRPVRADFSEEYKIPIAEDNSRPWPTAQDESNTVNFSMPLGIMYKHTDAVSTQYYSFDIGKGLSYLFMASEMFPRDYERFDEIFFENDGYTVLSKTAIEVDGIKGFSYKLSKPGEEVEHHLGRVFFHNHIMYYLEVGAYEGNTLVASDDPATFLDTFQVINKPTNKWTTLRDEKGAFSIKIPRHYSSFSGDVMTGDFLTNSSQFEQKYFAGSEQSNTWLFARWMDLEDRLEVDSLQLVENLTGLENYLSLKLEIEELNLKEEPPTLLFSAQYEEENLGVSGKLVLRGNRIYQLVSVNKPGAEAGKKFLPSFRFIPYQINKFNHISYTKDSLLSFNFPVEPAVQEVNLGDNANAVIEEISYNGIDSLSAANYSLKIQKHHPFYTYFSPDKYFDKRLGNFLLTKPNHQIINEAAVLTGAGEYYKELHLKTEETRNQLRCKFSNIGGYSVEQCVSGSKEYLFSASVDSFFNSVLLNESALLDKQKIAESKADSILSYFNSGNPDKIKYAAQAFDPILTFDENYFSDVHNLITKEWPKGNMPIELHQQLIVALANMNLANKTSSFMQLFKELEGKQTLQEVALGELAKFETAESMAAFFQLYRDNKSIQETGGEAVFKAFYEDNSRFLTELDRIVLLMEEGKSNIHFWRIAKLMLLQKPEKINEFQPYLPQFIQHGKKHLEGWKYYEETDKFGLPTAESKAPFHLLTFFEAASLESEEVIDFATQLFTNATHYQEKLWAAAFLLKNGEKLHRKTLRSLLEMDAAYGDLLGVINSTNSYNQLRAQDYDQQKIADGMIEKQLNVRFTTYTDVNFIETVTARFKGKNQKFYIYSFATPEINNRIAVVGAFSSDENEMQYSTMDYFMASETSVSPLRRTLVAKELVVELNSSF